MKLIYNGPVDGPLFVFAHGAGGGADSHFMENIAQGLALRGIRVARFNFPYMQQAIDNGTRRPPERAPKLIVQYAALLASLAQPMVIAVFDITDKWLILYWLRWSGGSHI